MLLGKYYIFILLLVILKYYKLLFYKYYRVVLVVFDFFDKNYIKEMMNILFCKFGFLFVIIY